MRAHTIGEVLNRLRDEFADITISRIRHLEAEGLITPDRTESGYRKFTEDDIERLRFVLRAQRERDMSVEELHAALAELDVSDADQPGDPGVVDSSPAAASRNAPAASADSPTPVGEATLAFDLDTSDLQLTRADLADASGLRMADVDALCDHGVLRGDQTFDGDDLKIARIAARMLETGLEPRHLRMYRQFADREAALLEQRVGPMLRQRNPDSRREASVTSEQLATLGAELQRVLLDAELRRLLRSWR